MKCLFVFIASVLIGLNCSAQVPATDAHVRELLELSGSAKIGIQVMSNMIEAYKKQMSSVPNEFWDEFSKEINPKDLTDLLVPIYAKYFSDAEMLQLIQFYKSPIGMKLTEKLPMITQDSYAAGAEWGQKIAEKVVARLKEKGYLENN